MKAGKRLCAALLAIALLCGLAACGRPVADPAAVAGKTYVYEGEGFGGSFTITLKKDGSFTYSEGPLSSYLGLGLWSMEGELLVLADDDLITGSALKNQFRVADGALVFVAEGSTNFTAVQVADGARFLPEA